MISSLDSVASPQRRAQDRLRASEVDRDKLHIIMKQVSGRSRNATECVLLIVARPMSTNRSRNGWTGTLVSV